MWIRIIFKYIFGILFCLTYNNCKLVNFEDDGPGSKKADLVFNALFDSSYISNIYGGEKYYICDESFLGIDSIKINDVVKNVFVCFGGADPANYTEKLLEIIANDKYKNNLTDCFVYYFRNIIRNAAKTILKDTQKT